MIKFYLIDLLYCIIEYPFNIYPTNPTTKNTRDAIDIPKPLDKRVNNKGENALPIA